MPENIRLLRACGEAALDYQKATCPVDTGRMVGALGIEEIDGGKTLHIGVVKYKVDYALYVEEGHKTRGGTWVPPQPFIRPSLDAAKKGLR